MPSFLHMKSIILATISIIDIIKHFVSQFFKFFFVSLSLINLTFQIGDWCVCVGGVLYMFFVFFMLFVLLKIL